MKKVGKILTIIFTAIFLWILIIPLDPIQPSRLKGVYYICNMADLNSWSPVQARIQSIKTLRLLDSEAISLDLNYLNPNERPLVRCIGSIPAYTLYKAQTLNVRIKINQPAEFGIALRKVTIGPGWGKKIMPNEVNKPILLTWLIERAGSGGVLKLNWLSGDFDGVAISLDQFDHSKPLTVTIYEIYLK